MTPEQFKAWQDQHGGPGENTPSPADSQGLVTHRAADGAWMVIGPSGLVSQGPRPGVTDGDAGNASTAPGAALPPGTPVTTDEQLRAWLDQHGGGPGINKNNERQIDGPPDKDTGVPTKVRSVDSTTVTAPDGATLTLRRPAGGQGYEQVAETPPKTTRAAATGTTGSNPRVPAGSVPRIEGTPVPGQAGQFDNSQPIRAWHAPDGSVVYEPLTPAEVQQWQRDKNGGKTDAEQTAAQTASQGSVGSKILQVNGKTYYEVTKVVPATATTPATTTTSYEDENHNPIASLPVQAKPGDIVHGGGSKGEDVQAIPDPDHPGQVKYVAIPGAAAPGVSPYTQVTQDPSTKKWWGLKKDGTGWTEVPGGPGSADQKPAAGPPRPNMIVGHTVEALNQYGDQLDAQVAAGTITPAQRTEYWNQAKDMATLATNEATLAQHQAEASLNASVQLANNRATNANSGFNAALQAVMDLNGKLPKGSHAGAEAFISLLGLQMMNQQAATGGDAAIKWPAAAPAGPTRPNAIGLGNIGASTAPGAPAAAPAPPTSPVAPPPTAGEPGGPPLAPGPVLGDPTPPAVAGTPSPLGDTGAPPMAPSVYTDPSGNVYRADGKIWSVGPSGTPHPVGAWDPAKGQPPGATPAGPQAQADPGSAGDFAVLAPYQQQAAPPPPPAAVPPDVGMPTALLYSQAAMTPFWKMTPEQYQMYKDAGVPDSVIKSGTPGVAA